MQEFLAAGLADSTAKAYAVGQRRYLQFCQQVALSPLPASEHQLMLFASFLAVQGLRWQTIKSYLAAVRNLHLTTGSPFPGQDESLPRLQLLLRGIRRVSSVRRPARSRLPITPAILRRVKAVVTSQAPSWDGRMIWAAMNLCFFGFLRSGELCCPSATSFDGTAHLAPEDLSLDSLTCPSQLSITIKASKTDPFRLGVTLVLGATKLDLCPLAAILPYVALRGAQAGPLFRFENGQFLTRDRFVAEVRTLLRAAGVDTPQYSGHSFRIGAATTAALAGLDGHTIQTLGRWHSSAYLAYIRLPRESLSQVSTTLVASRGGQQ